ncbi:YpiB family protein [Alkalihalobacillus sp. 1P02AB]|uniref:YpiB family protein n=1 Tax=Alkalihalobacillus sp. 1P02AB TaxID=3132260 RepID=UPI0039A43668
MKKWVSNEQKRGFLQWFIKNNQLKNKEAKLILDQFIRNHHLLDQLKFTDSINKNKKTMIISSYQSDEPGFMYYNKKTKTDNLSSLLDDLVTNPTESFYLILNFNGKSLNHRYLQLLENEKSDNFQRFKRFKKYEEETNQVIEQLIKNKDKEALMKAIDEALDNRDKVLFNKLVEKLQEL